MEKHFEPQTKAKARDQARVLLLDGHSSHYTFELLQYVRAHNIIILGYPPHCTHALQGLEVVCFARMKEIWKAEISTFEQSHGRGVNKEDFVEVFGKAYLKAFTPETVKAAFSATGIFPFDRTVITEEQMKPSETTSTKGGFPLPQPSPVRAVLEAYNTYWSATSTAAIEAHAPSSTPSTPTHNVADTITNTCTSHTSHIPFSTPTHATRLSLSSLAKSPSTPLYGGVLSSHNC
jgi:hypothetical protein